MRFGRTVGVTLLVGLAALTACSTRTSSTMSGGRGWVEQSPATRPPAIAGSAMAYDPRIGRVVLFGGSTVVEAGPPRLFSDTWTYDGTTWARQSPPNSPSPRQKAAMAYDPAIGKIVVFGGEDNAGWLFDTWTYDGTTWTEEHPAAAAAPALGAMTYDPAIGKLVLFGRDFSGSSTIFRNEIWSYDGRTWTEDSVTVADMNSPSPPAGPTACNRLACPLVYDANIEKLIYFTGQATWTYDGSKWAEAPPSGRPIPPISTALAYDATLRRTVLFGGCTADYTVRGGRCVSHNGTWAFDGSTWSEQFPSTAPPPRGDALMVYDSTRNRLVLFGGGSPGPGQLSQPSGGPLNDTWTYEPVRP